MKVSSCIRKIYQERIQLYILLSDIVDKTITAQKEKRWHFESRIKSEQSYALKLETGRYPSTEIDDFYAATLVVEDYSKIEQAVSIIGSNFEIRTQKPTADSSGKQKPWDFKFSDIRLICRLGERWSDKAGLYKLEFEIQIKTFLQHAWSIATHDIVYKSASPNWSLERVAFQLKSMLEHAELSILEAKSLGESKLIQRDHFDYRHIDGCISLLHEFWTTEELPSDTKRLAENVSRFINFHNFSIDETRQALLAKRENLGGNLYLNVSPFNTIVEVLYSSDREKFLACLDSLKAKKRTLIIPDDIAPASDEEVCNHKGVVIIKGVQ